MISASAALLHPAEVNSSITERPNIGGLSEGEEREKTKCLSGFIFMCNQITKFDCYRYRVFGLPYGKKEVVEEIKPGSKLFLFDFELKRLYGVYEATSAGNLNLEPNAFGGKYPAQVKFRIFKECLPILESSLRYVIKENYTGTKFKQELNETQVTKLVSSFRPLLASKARANISLPGAMPPSVMENQLKQIGRLPVMDFPYSAENQYSHIQPTENPRSALNVNYQVHGLYRREASSYYGSDPQPLLAEDVSLRLQHPSYSRYTTMERIATHDEFTVFGRQCPQLPVQSESLYQNSVAAYSSNSTTGYQCIPSAFPTHPYASYHQFADHSSNPAAPAVGTSGSHQQVPAAYFPLQNEALHQDNATAFNSNSTATDQYAPSVMQTRPYAFYPQYSDPSSNPAVPPQDTTSDSHQQVPAAYLPSQTEAPRQDSATQHYNLMALAQYASSVLQTHVPVHYQGSVDAFGSNPRAPTQYTTSSLQPEVQATHLPQQREILYQRNVAQYYSNPTIPAQYAKISQPQVSATSLPVQSDQVNVAAYNSKLMVADQYTPSSRQPEVLGHAVADGSAPISTYFPYSAADHLSC